MISFYEMAFVVEDTEAIGFLERARRQTEIIAERGWEVPETVADRAVIDARLKELRG